MDFGQREKFEIWAGVSQFDLPLESISPLLPYIIILSADKLVPVGHLTFLYQLIPKKEKSLYILINSLSKSIKRYKTLFSS